MVQFKCPMRPFFEHVTGAGTGDNVKLEQAPVGLACMTCPGIRHSRVEPLKNWKKRLPHQMLHLGSRNLLINATDSDRLDECLTLIDCDSLVAQNDYPSTFPTINLKHGWHQQVLRVTMGRPFEEVRAREGKRRWLASWSRWNLARLIIAPRQDSHHYHARYDTHITVFRIYYKGPGERICLPTYSVGFSNLCPELNIFWVFDLTTTNSAVINWATLRPVEVLLETRREERKLLEAIEILWLPIAKRLIAYEFFCAFGNSGWIWT